MAWAHHAGYLLMLAVAVLASVTDLRTGRIPNKLLRKALWAVAGLAALVAMSSSAWWPLPPGLPPDVSLRHAALAVAGNVAFGLIASMLLYVFGLWAAGDAKLAMVLALAQPAWVEVRSPLPWAPFAVVLGNTFVAAVVVVVVEVIWRRAPSSLAAVRSAIAERRLPFSAGAAGEVMKIGLAMAALIAAFSPVRRLAGRWAAVHVSGGYFLALLVVVLAYRPLKRFVATRGGFLLVAALFAASAAYAISTGGLEGLYGIGHSLLFCLGVMALLGLLGVATRPLDQIQVPAEELKPGMVLTDAYLDELEVERRWAEAFAPVIHTLRGVKLDDNLIKNLREWHAHNAPDSVFLVQSHVPFAPAFAAGVALTAIFGRLLFIQG